MQTLTRRGVGDAAAGLGLQFLHMSEGPFWTIIIVLTKETACPKLNEYSQTMLGAASRKPIYSNHIVMQIG